MDKIFEKDRAAAPEVQGKWFEIRLSPDLVSGELLNIGVGFRPDRSKNFSFRLIENASPFVCLYGRAAREQFEFLLRSTRQALTAHGPVAISPHITYGKPRHAAGNSVTEILDELFASVVTLGRLRNDTADTRDKFKSLGNEEVRHIVFEAMRDRDKLLANLLITGGEHPLIVDSDDGPHELFFPLRHEARFGTVSSAWYKDHGTAESNIKGALLDLSVAIKKFPQNQPGLFILRASSLALSSEDDQARIDNIVDFTEWRAKTLGVLMRADDNPVRLAEDILEWGIPRRRSA